MLKHLSLKLKRFLNVPNSMKRLYIAKIFDRARPKQRLINAIYRLTREDKASIISIVNKAEESKCLARIVHSYEKTNGTLNVWELIFIQALVYIIKPDVVIETGVAHGSSSMMILEAMEFNQKGRLYSIDLPIIKKGERFIPFLKGYEFKMEDISYVEPEYPTGWLVPEHLRHRWRLILGDSLIEMPRLLRDLEYVDIFHHDSLHLYGQMFKEFNFAWPKIRPKGLLTSHDIFIRNHAALAHFAAKTNRKAYSFQREGAIVK
jgi:hypothetical protein